MLARVSCGCETASGHLVTLCGMHANYTRQHVETARAPRGDIDKQLQRDLVVGLAPIVVSRSNTERDSAEDVANKLHSQVHEIMRRMD